MRKKLAGIILAIATGLGGVIVMPAPPANADILSVVGIIKQIYSIWQTFSHSSGGGGLTLSQATQEILNEIQSSQNDILNQVDQLFTAQAQACANDAVLEFADINSFTTDVLQSWAQSTTSCVELIESLWSSIPSSNFAALNTLGMALGSVGPIALIARAKAGFSTTGLTSVLVQGFTNVKNAMTPGCSYEPNDPTAEELMDAGDPDYFYIWTYYTCVSPVANNSLPTGGYGGAQDLNYWQDYACLDCDSDYTNIGGVNLIQEAGQDTTWDIATTVLPELQG